MEDRNGKFVKFVPRVPASQSEYVPPKHASWKAEIITSEGGNWSSNALRFATREEAEGYVQNLYARWTMVHETRVVESDDPVTDKWDVARPAMEPRPRAPVGQGLNVEIIKPGDIGRVIAELTRAADGES